MNSNIVQSNQVVGAGRYGYEGKRKSAEELANDKRRERRELMPEMQSFRQIENTIVIRLNPRALEELKQIAIENRQLTYSDLIIFLVKKYHESHTRDSS